MLSTRVQRSPHLVRFTRDQNTTLAWRGKRGPWSTKSIKTTRNWWLWEHDQEIIITEMSPECCHLNNNLTADQFWEDPSFMNMVEEIMIATGIIKLENTITLSEKSPESGILFHTDTPNVMIQSIWYISDDYSTCCTDFRWCVRTYKNRMRGQKTNQYKTRRCARVKKYLNIMIVNHMVLPLPYQSIHILSWYKDDGNRKWKRMEEIQESREGQSRRNR